MIPRTMANERKRQIDTLKIFNDGVSEKIEDAEYEVSFIGGSNQMSLEVILPQEFPNEKPIIRINPQVVHPWIAPNCRDVTLAPGLLNFSVHSDLGRVVQAIIREFERNPPQIIEDIDLNKSPTLQSDGHLSHSSSGTLTKSSSSFGLDNLTDNEMELILNDADYLDRHLEKLPQSIDMEKVTRDLILEIENLANANLAKHETIEELKNNINNRVNKINSVKEKYDDLQNKHRILTQPFTLNAVTESLRTAAIEADTESEDVVKQFLNGSIDVEYFIKLFGEKKCLAIQRKAKLDRLSHQLKQLNKA